VIPTGDLDLALMALIGALLVFAGLAMLFLARRRGKTRGSDGG
jgi:LPXTG-motif cell wall-anchored protein